MRPALLFRLGLAAAALGLGLSPLRADEAAIAAAAVLQKSSLAALDHLFDRRDALLARDDDARHQAATRAELDVLKKKREALRLAYDQSKCDDLRTELNLAYHRLAAWVGPPRAAP